MMKTTKRRMPPLAVVPRAAPTVYFLLGLMMLLACSGSGGGSDLLAGGGIGGTGISIGEISGFGSVIVNDVDFDTQKTQVVVNGQAAGAGNEAVRKELALGMVVRVEGRFSGNDTGKADRIVFTENLNGPVTMIELLDSVVKKIVILGQNVIVDDRTQFKDTDFDSLSVGDVLRISGWPDETGIIQATYVAKTIPADGEAAVKGMVTEVDVRQKILQINQLTVDYSEADLEGFPDDQPAVGQLVFAGGFLDANDVLVATQLRLVDDLGLDDADDVEIEGIVTQFSSPQEFILGTTPVQTDGATTFQGIEADEIFIGARLFIKGALFKGRLLADEVVAKDKVNIQGQVADVNGTEIRLKGLDNLIISVSNLTKIFGDADQLDEIQNGQKVKVIGYVVAEDQVWASQMKVENKESDKVKLQGPITAINEPTIYILGVAVDTSQIDDVEFEEDDDDDDDDQIQDFFENIAVGQVVNARGTLIDDRVVWQTIEADYDD